MRTDTIKFATISQVKDVLRSNKKYYVSTDFPFIQLDGFYISYQGKVMNRFLHDKGFMMVKGKELDFNKINSNVKVRGNRNVYITMNNYLRYKKEKA